MFRVLQVEPGSVVPSLDALLRRIHPDDRDELREELARVVGDGPPLVRRVRLAPNGRPAGASSSTEPEPCRTVELRCAALVDITDRSVRRWGTIQDVTPATGTQDERGLENSSLFRETFERAPIGIALIDERAGHRRRVLAANSALGVITGRSAAELSGANAEDVLPSIGADGEQFGRFDRPDGGTSWRGFRRLPVRGDDGRPWLSIVFVLDLDHPMVRQHAVLAAENRMRRALDASLDGFAVYQAVRDGGGAVVGLRMEFINSAGAAGFGGGPDQLIGSDLLEIYPEGRENGLWTDMVTALDTGTSPHRRIETGGPSWSGWKETVQIRLDHDHVLSTWRDITRIVHEQQGLLNALAQAAQARATLDTALNASPDGFAVFDLDPTTAGDGASLRVVHANHTAARTLGVAAGDLLGSAPTHALSRQVWDRVRQALLQHVDAPPRADRLHLADDEGTWTASYDLTVSTVETGRVVLTWRDVSRDERARREIEVLGRAAEYNATHDVLTGLPNAVLLRQRLADSLASRMDGERVGVAVCDLNGLGEVNRRYGHDVGDAVLRATAERLRRVLGAEGTAARLGDDEFAMVVPRQRPGGRRTRAWLAQVRQRLSQPVAVRNTVIVPSVSLGMVLGDLETGPQTKPEQDAEAMLTLAYEALHRSRSSGHPVVADESAVEAERARLAALTAYDIHNPRLDELLRAFTQIAASTCCTKFSILTFIDSGVQWVRAANTLDIGAPDELCGPRHLALCDHTIRARRLLVIPDMSEDPRYRPSPHTRWQSGSRFYAGAPLITPEGRAIGTLCVLDPAPATLSDRQRRSLHTLADEVITVLDAHRPHHAL